MTAIVVSNLSLTSLHWSPPEQCGPSKTITVRHGNITTTTLMVLENATLDNGGNYTLIAVNECGRSSSQVKVEVLTGKLMSYMHTAYIHRCVHTYIHALIH